MVGARLAPPKDRHWHLEVTGSFRKLPFDKKGRAELDERELEYEQAIDATLKRVRRDGWMPGTYDVREGVRLLVVSALDGEGGRWSFDLFDKIEPAYKVEKAADILDDALERSIISVRSCQASSFWTFRGRPIHAPLAPK